MILLSSYIRLLKLRYEKLYQFVYRCVSTYNKDACSGDLGLEIIPRRLVVVNDSYAIFERKEAGIIVSLTYIIKVSRTVGVHFISLIVLTMYLRM